MKFHCIFNINLEPKYKKQLLLPLSIHENISLVSVITIRKVYVTSAMLSINHCYYMCETAFHIK